MTCPDCAAAAQRLHHGFAMGCAGCRARGVARTKLFRDAQALGQQTRQYRALLDQAGVTHAAVREAHACDFLNRAVPETRPERGKQPVCCTP